MWSQLYIVLSLKLMYYVSTVYVHRIVDPSGNFNVGVRQQGLLMGCDHSR